MGRIGAPQGLKGWLHVQSFTESPGNLLHYKCWGLRLRGQWQKVEVLEGRVQGKGLVVHLAGYDTRDAAMALVHAEIGIDRQDLPALEAGEYYWADLIGMRVQSENTEDLGRKAEDLGQVESLLETGANDVLVVKGETREHLIPYILGETVLSVDLENRLITVSWDPDF